MDAKDKEIKFLKNIIGLLPGHIYWKDKKGVILGCNNKQAESAGFSSREELIGKTAYDLPWKDQAKAIHEMDARVMKSDQEQTDEEKIKLANGKEITVLSQKVPLHDESGNITGLLGISIDITAAKKREAELRAMKEQIATVKAKSELLSIIDHELRTPINDITGAAELLQLEEKLSVKQIKLIDVINSASSSMMPMMDHLMNYVALDSGELKVNNEEIDLYALLHDLVAAYSDQAFRKNISDIIFDYQLPYRFARSDVRLLHHVIETLLNNAIRTSQCGYVFVKVEETSRTGSESTVKISITDQGPGISLEKQKVLFELFTQHQNLSETESKKYIDAGLRLSISKRMVELLGGKIGVFSELGNGSTFWIDIKLPIISKINNTDKTYSDSWKQLKNLNVLLIDDNKDRSQTIGDILSKVDVKLDKATSDKILKDIKGKVRKKYDIIILDSTHAQQQIISSYAEKSAFIVLKDAKLYNYKKLEELDKQRTTYIDKPIFEYELLSALIKAKKKARQRIIKVLLIEDDRINLMIEKMLLEKLSCHVETATSLEEAIAKLNKEYDIIFTDISLPDGNGMEVISNIKRLKKDNAPPIIAVTSYSADSDCEKFIESGMYDVIRKPATLETFKKIIDSITINFH
jgi:PAS domain S-box-containing protein